MKQPPYISKGDKICILSTARKITMDELKPSIDLLKGWGLNVVLGKNLFQVDHQFAGTEEQRATDLQTALDDDSIKAILFARGGYGSVQIVDRIDWSTFNEYPKWLVGYSDITVFHSHLNRQLGIESLHAAMPVNIKVDHSGLSEEGVESLRSALFGNQLTYQFPASTKNLLMGEKIEGELVGGNLSILYSLSGTASQIKGEGKILFIEDLDEYLYHIDRMMMNLIRSGLFNGCKGILVGGMSDMNDNTIPYGKSAKEIILHRIKGFDVPLIFDFPAGHIIDNRALILGRKVAIQQTDSSIQLEFNERTQ